MIAMRRRPSDIEILRIRILQRRRCTAWCFQSRGSLPLVPAPNPRDCTTLEIISNNRYYRSGLAFCVRFKISSTKSEGDSATLLSPDTIVAG